MKAGAVLAAAVVMGGAQLSASGGGQLPRPDGQLKSHSDAGGRRDHIHMMEGVLTAAVRNGAEQLSRRIQAVDPGIVLLSGSLRARGFVLDGYGVFFDVEIPGVRPSVAWSIQTLQQRNRQVDSAVAALRRYVDSVPDPASKAQLDSALRRVELQVSPSPMVGQPTPGTVTAADAKEVDPADPSEQYTEVVKSALIEAMLDYSEGMKLQADEWLTIAARDSEGPMMPGVLEDAATIVLRVRGSDLAAYRMKQITKDEARKKVEVREF